MDDTQSSAKALLMDALPYKQSFLRAKLSFILPTQLTYYPTVSTLLAYKVLSRQPHYAPLIVLHSCRWDSAGLGYHPAGGHLHQTPCSAWWWDRGIGVCANTGCRWFLLTLSHQVHHATYRHFRHSTYPWKCCNNRLSLFCLTTYPWKCCLRLRTILQEYHHRR